ncbi:MAG: nucleoside phosphorylase [Thermotogae bacterium]|nr:MAG: nucleoside phosphorylase [Thermotogota bacterium]
MAEDPRYHIKVDPDDLGKYVIVVGDRGRVQRVAKYLESAKKAGDNREYLTYTGTIQGEKVSVMSTGMGAPAMAIGVEELATAGVHTVIRVGTSGALQRHLKLGESVITTGAIRRDGTTLQYLPPEFPAVADFEVTQALVEAAKALNAPHHVGIVYSTDSYYGRLFDEESHLKYNSLMAKAGALVVEMEVGALFIVGTIKGMKVGSVLTVREELTESGEYIQAGETYEKGLERSIRIAVEAIRRMIERSRGGA